MIARTALAALAALLASLPHAAEAQSLYTGSLERDGAALVLRACDLTAHRFLLVDAPGHEDTLRRRLPERLGSGRDLVVVSVVARYSEAEGRSVLSVTDVTDVVRGAPCRLIDALDERFREAEAARQAPAKTR